jgi:hypothetical protein
VAQASVEPAKHRCGDLYGEALQLIASPERKTDVLNLRRDPALAGEIQPIAEWRGTSASEIARELMRHGVAVE